MQTREIADTHLTIAYANRKPWLVCFSAALFFFYEFIQMHMFNSISMALMREFGLNAKQLGYLSASFFYADVLFLFPAGIILDRFSTRKIVISGLVLCIFSTLGFAVAKTAFIAGLFHALAGVGNAFCFVSCIILASRWFPSEKTGFVIGFIVTIAMLGGVVAQAPFVLLSHLFGWRGALLINTVMGLLILAMVLSFVYDSPLSLPNQKDHLRFPSQLAKVEYLKNILAVFLNRQNWYCAIYTCLLNLPIMLLGGLWGNLYLVQVFNQTSLLASHISAMIFIGTIVGAPLLGAFSDHISLRKLPMVVCAILALLLMIILMYWPHLTVANLFLLFFSLGMVTSAQVVSYPTIVESNPSEVVGIVTGLTSVIIMGGVAVFQPLFGWLIELHHNNSVNSTYYSAADFQYALWIFPVAFSISIIASVLMRETFCVARSLADLSMYKLAT